MTKKEYEKAAEIVRALRAKRGPHGGLATKCVENAFVELFTSFVSNFDEVCFRAACAAEMKGK